jgi:nucleoside-diphosphate-sugar epimerase
MEAPEDQISVRTSYNVAAISFTPSEIAESIQKNIPDFEIRYEPDYRQDIADSWPDSIDDSAARDDWGWEHSYELDDMTGDILANLPDVIEKA